MLKDVHFLLIFHGICVLWRIILTTKGLHFDFKNRLYTAWFQEIQRAYDKVDGRRGPDIEGVFFGGGGYIETKRSVGGQPGAIRSRLEKLGLMGA